MVNTRMKSVLTILFLLLPGFGLAHTLASRPEELSVEANIREMDTDRDGMVTMSEVKAYLQKHYGKEYKQKLLEKLEARAEAKSCSSPFSRPTF